MASFQSFQSRELKPEEKAKLEKAEKKIDELEAERKKWSDEVAKSPIGSGEEKKAKEQRDYYTQERDKAQLQLDKLKVEFGQMPPLALLEASGAKVSAVDLMRAKLEIVKFPLSPTEYEFPDFELPEGHQYADSVREACVKMNFTTGEPDFLLTRLDERLGLLEEFNWNSEARRLSRSGIPEDPVELNLSRSGRSTTCLVGASGVGKTRFLYEKCNEEFGAYITAAPRKHHPAESVDLENLLARIPANLIAQSLQEHIEQISATLTEGMRKILLARALVLEAAISACKTSGQEFLPRHWLALQLFPTQFVILESNAIDVFAWLCEITERMPLSPGNLNEVWYSSRLKFVAFDEAQVADALCPEVFPSRTDTSIKRSALSPLVQAVHGVQTSLVLSGTGLGIRSAYETAESGTAKANMKPRLIGLTTSLTADTLVKALHARGVKGPIDPQVAELFIGRPRFAMRLVTGLLRDETPTSVENDIVVAIREGIIPKLKTRTVGPLQSTKTVYSEVRFAAIQWTLRGDPSISSCGALALELGVAEIEPIKRSETTLRFVIREPLMIKALGHMGTVELENISTENAATIGHMLECYIALKAGDILDLLGPERLRLRNTNDFLGPWVLAKPDASQQQGIGCNDTMEPAAIRRILEIAGETGPSLVFPSTMMGADVVFAAKRESDNRRLLVFAQVKASLHSSGPKAMKTLTLPYHRNRYKTPSIDAGHRMAYDDLNNIIADTKTSVVFMVFKFPTGIKKSDTILAQYRGKKVLHVFVDGKNQTQLVPGLRAGVQSLNNAKRLHILAEED